MWTSPFKTFSRIGVKKVKHLSVQSFIVFTGYSTIVEIPAGARDIFIKEMNESKNSIGKIYMTPTLLVK